MAVIRHVHKYRLVNLGTKEKPRKVYACAHPECTHFMPHLRHVLGKKTICWKCNKETIMSDYILKNLTVHPRCKGCREVHRAERLGVKIKPKLEKEKKKSVDAAIDMLFAMRGVEE